MQSLKTLTLGVATLTLSLAACSSTSGGQASAPAAMDEAAMMQAMTQLATPGPEHAELAKHAGTWRTFYETKMGPDAPWTKSEGLTTGRMILGGRFLYEDITFDIPGMPPMQGVHILGYDNLSKQFESHWMDTMSTWMIHSTGTVTEDGALEFKGTMTDVMGSRPFRMMMRDQADGSSTMEMYDTLPGGQEVLMMKATSKRI